MRTGRETETVADRLPVLGVEDSQALHTGHRVHSPVAMADSW